LVKPFIASIVFTAEINISTPIARWIGADIVPRAADISVAQLLNHTSGLRDYGGLKEYSQAIQAGETPWSDDVFGGHTLRKPLLFEPGEGWAYSNPGYWLLSKIVQTHTGLGFDEMIHRFIVEPLGLTATQVAHGQFADDLPGYPAEWVWHGLLTSSASDLVRFMMSPLIDPLLGKLTRVPVEHPRWADPHNGYGLMVDPGSRYGHNGGGPNYSASCIHFIKSGLTGCVLMRADREEEAMNELLKQINTREETMWSG
jgi:D-alanyl-D-alanine carboxypeptidase